MPPRGSIQRCNIEPEPILYCLISKYDWMSFMPITPQRKQRNTSIALPSSARFFIAWAWPAAF